MLKAAFIFIYLKLQNITVTSRKRMVFMRLEEGISSAHSVRFVAISGENFDLNAFGFELQTLKTEGGSRLNTPVFLKIYLLGYLIAKR